MTETVLWETHRCRERGGFVERLVAVDDGHRAHGGVTHPADGVAGAQAGLGSAVGRLGSAP